MRDEPCRYTTTFALFTYATAVAALGTALGCTASGDLHETSVGGATATLAPSADAYVRSGSYAAQNFGTAKTIQIDSGARKTVKRGYLRFDLGQIASVASARLRLYVVEGSSNAGTFRTTTDTTWGETSVTWNNAPPIDGPTVATVGSVAAGSYVTVDVTAAARAGGAFSLAFVNSSGDGVQFASREATDPAQRPQLQIDTGTTSTDAGAVIDAMNPGTDTGTDTGPAIDAGTDTGTDTGPAIDAGTDTGTANDSGTPSPTGAPLVRVAGNRLVDQNGNTVRLLGMNRSGTQYACIEGWGFFDGPSDAASVDRMKAWGATAVRVSLNETCWLGINGAPSRYSGAAYQTAILNFVQLLNSKGLVVVLDLHWSAPGTLLATDQLAMPGRDHAPDFWRSVATAFKSNHSVLFDLYNEPFPDSNHNTTAAWTCVRDGGNCPGVSFVAAGMQELVTAVRSTGATQPIMVGGPQYAGMVDRWLEFKPSDPQNQLVASIHIYGPNWAPCDTQSCWDGTIAPLAQQVPIVMGEIGDKDCTHLFIDPLMTWADAHGVSYLAWSWFTGSCSDEPALISSYDGTPTPYGIGLRDHLLSLARPQ